MKFVELQTQNCLEHICSHWGIPLQLCEGIRVFRLASIPALPFNLTVFKNNKHSVSIAKGCRIVKYGNGSALVIANLPFGQFDYYLFSPIDFDFLEIGKLCVLSSIGILKENQGFTRLHAGFFQQGDRKHLILGRSGSGKSTFFANALKDSTLQVFADELCFIKDQNIYPVPLHVHIKPQQLIPLKTVNQLLKYDCNSISFLERSKGQSRIAQPTSSEIIIYFSLLFLGDGLHQMAAYHLRFRYIPHWCLVLARRFFVFFKMFLRFEVQKQLVQDSNYFVRS